LSHEGLLPGHATGYSKQCCAELASILLAAYSAGDVTISGNVTFTVDSDLNGESSQFSLTCTSTGGPATTVTWTRDSETVSGGMTVLDDPVTAQYTHTLTVAGRLGGQYQCTVSNNKPSDGTANFTVQGRFQWCKREIITML